MAQLIELEFNVDQKSLVKFDKRTKNTVEKALVLTVEKALDRIEKATLIRDYTQNSKPSKPQGSTYTRTFRMQHSSVKKITRDKIPVEGKWEAKIKYASYVIGPVRQQAEIHRNRWPSLELAINNVNLTINDDFDKAMKKANK